MPTIAPWLNVNPKDFVSAAQAGAELGQRVAQMRTQAAIEQQRIAAEVGMNAARVAAERDVAGSRAAQSQAERDAARQEFAQRMMAEQSRIGIEQQNANRMGLSDEARIGIERQNAERMALADAIRAQQGQTRLGLYGTKLQSDADAAASLGDYRKNVLGIQAQRLADQEKRQADYEAAKAAGTISMPTSVNTFDMNPGRLTVPATDPRARSFLSGTNINPLLRAPAPAAAPPASRPVLIWNVEKGDFEPGAGATNNPAAPTASPSDLFPMPFDESEDQFPQ